MGPLLGTFLWQAIVEITLILGQIFVNLFFIRDLKSWYYDFARPMHFKKLCALRPEDCRLPLIEEAEREKQKARGNSSLDANDFGLDHEISETEDDGNTDFKVIDSNYWYS